MDIPTEEQVNALHKRYCDELQALFDENKEAAGYGEEETIKFLDI